MIKLRINIRTEEKIPHRVLEYQGEGVVPAQKTAPLGQLEFCH